MPTGRRIFVYKNNSRDNRTHGDFGRFFQEASGKSYEWGVLGVTMTRANATVWSRMRPGDLVVLYQTDKRSLVGTAQVGRVDSVATSRPELWLTPQREYLLRRSDTGFPRISAFAPGSYAALHEVTAPDERKVLRPLTK
jgi:hypothetical protein